MTTDFHDADESFLRTYANTEQDTLKYAVESILWLVNEHRTARHSWTTALDPSFMDALETLLRYFDDKEVFSAESTLQGVCKGLANWRDDLNAMDHPLAQLGRILRGDPGDHLEYQGPVFLTTVNDVFEGITHEYLVGEWDLTKDGTTLLGLCAVALAAIAQTCYWATKSQSAHLDTELERLFRKRENREALRGQLANLILAGQALGWGAQVEFISESGASTPDWSIGIAAKKLYVECTSASAQATSFNNTDQIRAALARGWNDKKHKFASQFRPGLISCDISRLYVSREHHTILNLALLERVDLDLDNNQRRTIGVYHTGRDFDLLAQESFDRTVIAVLASALYSKEALNSDIRGFLAYQGQQILVNTISGELVRPQRGILAWRGEKDEILYNAIKLSQPAIPNSIRAHESPPCYVHLV